MKKTKILASFILSMAILASCFSAFGVSAETADVSEAIDALKTAWSDLTENKTEVLAIPATAQRRETAAATDLTDEEKAAFGEYYYYNEDGAQYDYTYPVGQSGFKDYSGKSNVRYSFGAKITNMSDNFEITVCYGSAQSWQGLYPYCNQNVLKKFAFNADNVEGKDIRKISAIQIKNEKKAKMYLGCIYVSYDEPIGMPANYEFFTAENWLNTVYNTDFTDCNVTDEFKAAFKALESCTEEGLKLSALKEAYGSLNNTKTELYAVPNANYRYSAAELGDEEKAAFGEYYYKNSTGYSEDNYAPPVGQTSFADLSEKSNVKYTFKYKQDSVGNFQVKFTYTKTDGTAGDINSWSGKYAPYSDKINTLLTYTLDTAGTDISRNVVFRLAPNGRTLTVGCIYASYDEPITVPLNFELFSAEKLINAIYNTDLSACNLTEEFKTAFNAMKTGYVLARADVNSDYSFNSEDLTVLRQVLLGVASNCDGDINGNGSTDILDLVKIKKLLANVK